MPSDSVSVKRGNPRPVRVCDSPPGAALLSDALQHNTG